MNAVLLRAPGHLEPASVESPVPGPEDVLLRVSHGGICGTDLSLYSGAMPTTYPRVLGHEILAEVVQAGGDGLRHGQRVVVDPALACGDCYCCGAGLTNLCLRGGLVGREVDGGFAEYVVVPASHVFALPDGIDSGIAPLIQVLTTCHHAQRLVDLSPGRSVAVTGLGVAGQLHVQLARVRGAQPVIGITRSAWKRELAEGLGADLTLASGPEAVAAVREATGGLGADVVIECTGKTKTLAQAVGMARPGGTLLLFGTSNETTSELPFFQMYLKELKVLNTRAATQEDFPLSVELAASGAVQLGPLVSHTMPMRGLAEAMRLLESDADRRLKVILENDW